MKAELILHVICIAAIIAMLFACFAMDYSSRHMEIDKADRLNWEEKQKKKSRSN